MAFLKIQSSQFIKIYTFLVVIIIT